MTKSGRPKGRRPWKAESRYRVPAPVEGHQH